MEKGGNALNWEKVGADIVLFYLTALGIAFVYHVGSLMTPQKNADGTLNTWGTYLQALWALVVICVVILVPTDHHESIHRDYEHFLTLYACGLLPLLAGVRTRLSEIDRVHRYRLALFRAKRLGDPLAVALEDALLLGSLYGAPQDVAPGLVLHFEHAAKMERASLERSEDDRPAGRSEGG